MYDDIFRNCLSVQTLTGQMFCPVRFTDIQLEFYRKRDDFLYARALCTSGITMDFTTDQRTLSFHYDTHSFVRSHNTFDIYEEGELVQTVPVSVDHPSGTVEYKRRCENPSRVTIYLPAMACACISDLNIGSYVPVSPSNIRLLFFGDSITQGIECQHASMAYPSILGRRLSAETLNQGVGGFYFDQNSLDEKTSFNPDTVFIAYGTNDFRIFHDVNVIEEHAKTYFSSILKLYPKSRIVVIPPIWRADLSSEPERKLFQKTCSAIVQLAYAFGFVAVDGQALVDHEEELFTDGYLHPNDLGFGQYAERLCNFIKQKADA